MPMNWTLVHNGKTNDEADTGGDVAAIAVTGWLHLVAQMPEGMPALAPGVGDEGTSYWVRTFKAYLDSDGVLKNKPGAEGGTPGVRIWANDPVFSLEELPYLVYAPEPGLRANGKRVPFTSFVFNAPSEDIEKKFSELQPVPSATAKGISRGLRTALVKVSEDGVIPPLYQWQDEQGVLFGDQLPYTEIFSDSAAEAAPAAVAAAAPAAVDAYVEDKEPTVIADPDDPENKARIKIGTAVGPPFTASRNTVEALTNSGEVGRDVVKSATAAGARGAIGIPALLGIINRDMTSPVPEVFSTYVGKPDGPAPTHFDSGHPVLGSSGPGTNPQAIVENGVLTSKPTNHGPAAFYHIGQCPGGDVTWMGGRFRLRINEINVTTFNGNVCLAMLHSNDWSGGGPPSMGVHYVIKPDTWSIGVWDGFDDVGSGTGFDVKGYGNIYPPLELDDLTETDVQVWVEGDTCYFTIPRGDGVLLSFTDPRVAEFAGPYFFHEYQTPVADTDNRAGYATVAAASGKQYIPIPTRKTLPYYKEAKVAATETMSVAYNAYNVPGLEPEDANDRVTVPPSGRILVQFDCWVVRSTAANLQAGVSYPGGIKAKTIGHTTQGSFQDREKVSIVVGDDGELTPGTPISFTPVLFSSATDTQIFVDPDNNYGASISLFEI